MSDSNHRLVYSTDPAMNRKCPRCKELEAACRCAPEVDVKKVRFTAVLRIEKKGRGGKTVTVVDKLPKQEAFLKELCTKLKKRCGSGGTYLMDGPDGVVEIQGDKRELVRACLAAEGIPSKG